MFIPIQPIKDVLVRVIKYIKASTFENDHEFMLHGPFVNSIKWYNLLGWTMTLIFSMYILHKSLNLTQTVIQQRMTLEKITKEHKQCLSKMEELKRTIREKEVVIRALKELNRTYNNFIDKDRTK